MDNGYCIIDCDVEYQNISQSILCGDDNENQGCCGSYIECGDGLCQIKCSYNCNNMIIDAKDSNQLLVE